MSDFNILYLFENATAADTKKPYILDPVLNTYSGDEATFNTNLLVDEYLRTITGVTIRYENTQANNEKLMELLKVKNLSNISIAKTYIRTASQQSISPSSATNNQCGGSSSAPIISDTNPIRAAEIQQNDIVLDVIATNSIDKSTLISHMNNQLSSISASINNTLSHTTFDTYLSQINAAIAQLFFYTMVYQLNITENSQYGMVTNNAPILTGNIKDIAARIKHISITTIRDMLVPWKFYQFMAEMRELTKKVLTKIAVDIGMSKSHDFIKCFSSRTSMKSEKYRVYYMLFKQMMFDHFITTSVVINSDTELDVVTYIKKLVIEIYIMSAYPLIHYDFIDTLMKMYINLGDFVNARFGLLAKCMFTRRIIQKIITDVTHVPTSLSITFPTNLLRYLKLANLNNFSSSATTNEKIKDIVIELHKLSNDISDGSRKTEQLKSAIKDNQLSMRTIIASNKENIKKLNMQQIHFWILVSLIITVVAASGILYFFEKYDIGMMVAACILGVVLVYQAILIIIGFIKKN
jgi:hypothetical protein